jgi:hypothetical protein
MEKYFGMPINIHAGDAIWAISESAECNIGPRFESEARKGVALHMSCSHQRT